MLHYNFSNYYLHFDLHHLHSVRVRQVRKKMNETLHERKRRRRRRRSVQDLCKKISLNVDSVYSINLSRKTFDVFLLGFESRPLLFFAFVLSICTAYTAAYPRRRRLRKNKMDGNVGEKIEFNFAVVVQHNIYRSISGLVL